MRLLVIAVLAVAACEPDLDGTAFKCDGAHGCPSDQSCIFGRCRRAEPVAIACSGEVCMPDQQCCADFQAGTRCIGATDPCNGRTALCDSPDDCATGERCCNGKEVTACAVSCESDKVACASAADCPTDAVHCCLQADAVWGECSNSDCSEL